MQLPAGGRTGGENNSQSGYGNADLADRPDHDEDAGGGDNDGLPRSYKAHRIRHPLSVLVAKLTCMLEHFCQ